MSGIEKVHGSGGVDPEAPGALEPVVDARIGEQAVERGTVARVICDMGVTELRTRLEAGGASESEAKEEAAEITAAASEIQDLEKELAELKELEALYEEMLADPDLDYWDAAWLEYDLWEIRMDIYELEAELGTLEGSLCDYLAEAWQALLGAFTLGAALQEGEEEKAAARDDQLERLRRDHVRDDRSEEVRAGDREFRRAALVKKGLVRPIPPQSEAARDLIQRAIGRLEETKEDRSLETLKEIVKAVRDLREKIAERA